MKRFIMALAVCFIGIGSAQAEDANFYAGVGLGAFGLELKDPAAGISQKNTVFGGFLRLGVDFNEYLGGELRVGTTGSGTTTYPGGNITLSNDNFVSYLAKVQYPVTPDFSPYLMLGATTAKMKVSIATLGLFVSDSATQTGFSYGVGGKYSLDSNLSLGVEWMQYWTNVGLGAGLEGKIWGAVGTLDYSF